MKRYVHKEKKAATERVGFYIALSICMVAVGLAIWSAYSSFGKNTADDSDHYFASLKGATQAVAQDMTGVTEAASSTATEPVTDAPTSVKTESESTASPTERTKGFSLYDTATLPAMEDVDAEDDDPKDKLSAMEAVLKVVDNLVYPVKSGNVIKQYSETAVFSKTMKDYRAHTGCDFAAKEGENVYAMCDGKVKNISVSELYGVIIEVESPGFSVYYCGMSNEIPVQKGDNLSEGDTVGTVGQIPCESADESHVHIEIRVGKTLIDPLSVINKDE